VKKSIEKRLDKVFSEYVRKKETKNGWGKCVSCGTPKSYEQLDAGHFINRKWRATRWLEENVHIQCIACNRFGEGDAAGYALYMLGRYGQKKVEYLQALSRETAKFTDSEGELMIKDFRQKLDELNKKI